MSKYKIISLLGVLAIICTMNAHSQAATVKLVSAEEMAQRADRIFYGKVSKVHSFWERGRIVTEAALNVKTPLKGVTANQTITVRYTGGTVGPLTQAVSGSPSIKTGEELVIFLQSRKSYNLPIGRTQGIYKVRWDSKQQTHIATRDVSQLALISKKGTSITPNELPRIRELPLSNLIQEIKTHLNLKRN